MNWFYTYKNNQKTWNFRNKNQDVCFLRLNLQRSTSSSQQPLLFAHVNITLDSVTSCIPGVITGWKINLGWVTNRSSHWHTFSWCVCVEYCFLSSSTTCTFPLLSSPLHSSPGSTWPDWDSWGDRSSWWKGKQCVSLSLGCQSASAGGSSVADPCN